MNSIKKYGETIIKASEFVKQLDQHVRADAFKFLLAQECSQSSENNFAQPAPRTILQPEAKIRALAPQELIRKCGFSSFSDKTIVLGYWLEEIQKKPSFSISDLKTAFDQAREPLPKNPSDMLIKLEGTARLMKVEKVGSVQHYRLTGTAVQEVESKLNSENDKT